MIEFILVALIAPFILLACVVLSSEGECYYCGSRLGTRKVGRHKGKKHCGCSIINP